MAKGSRFLPGEYFYKDSMLPQVTFETNQKVSPFPIPENQKCTSLIREML